MVDRGSQDPVTWGEQTAIDSMQPKNAKRSRRTKGRRSYKETSSQEEDCGFQKKVRRRGSGSDDSSSRKVTRESVKAQSESDKDKDVVMEGNEDSLPCNEDEKDITDEENNGVRRGDSSSPENMKPKVFQKGKGRGNKEKSGEDGDSSDDEEVCSVCEFAGAADLMLLCDGENCEQAFHTFCLNPPLWTIPKGDWFCPLCTHEMRAKEMTSTTLPAKLHDKLIPSPKNVEDIIGWRQDPYVIGSDNQMERKLQYLVKWCCLSHDHNTWVPEEWLLFADRTRLATYRRKSSIGDGEKVPEDPIVEGSNDNEVTPNAGYEPENLFNGVSDLPGVAVNQKIPLPAQRQDEAEEESENARGVTAENPILIGFEISHVGEPQPSPVFQPGLVMPQPDLGGAASFSSETCTKCAKCGAIIEEETPIQPRDLKPGPAPSERPDIPKVISPSSSAPASSSAGNVTEDQKQQALLAARNLSATTTNPHATVVMRVGFNEKTYDCCLSHRCAEILPSEDAELSLLDSKGVLQKANWNAERRSLQGPGWRDFVDSHNLHLNDVLVMEFQATSKQTQLDQRRAPKLKVLDVVRSLRILLEDMRSVLIDPFGGPPMPIAA